MFRTGYLLALAVIVTVGCATHEERGADPCRIKPIEATVTKRDGTTLRGIVRVNSKASLWQIRNANGVFIVHADEVFDLDVHTPL